MASNIDPSQPTTLHPKFSKLRANFAAAKAEIEALQTTVINPAVQQALDLKVDASWLPGAPSNLPAPNGIQIVDNSNGTRDITLRWAAYEQGSLHANYLLVYVKEITTPGDSITSDDSSLLVSIKDRYITFKAFNPAATYRFGIAAVRSIEHNVDVSAIVQPTSAPDWLVEGGVVNFTGNIGGTAAQTVAYNASTALSNAAAAQAAAAALNQDIADMSSEDQNGNAFLTPAEKVTLRRDWDAIADEKSLIDAQAATYGLTTRRTNYLNAFTALADYLNGGTTWASGWPLWINDANMSVKTAIVRNVIRGHFKTYNSAKVSLLQKVADEAKAVADTAATAATAAASAASAAQVAAAAANDELADAVLDSKLSKSDKVTVIRDYNVILDKQSAIQARAAEMGIAEITTLSTTYADKINELTAYLTGLSPAYTDLTQSTTVVAATLKARFNGVYVAEQNLLGAMSVEAAKRAVWATGISGVPANLIALTGTEPIKNTLITINANGTLSGGGAGQVTLDGLGATAFASLAKITAANVDTFLGLNAINSTHIASLTADKIAAGTLAAGVVYAGTINSNQIVAANLAAITADLGTVTAGHITGSAGIDISGTANFTGTVTDVGSGVARTSTVRGWAVGSANPSDGILGRADGAGYGVVGANWSASGGGGVYGVSKSTVDGAGVYARNKAGGPALKVEGPMTIDDGTLVVNLNSYKLEGYRASYFAVEPTYGYLPLNSAYKIATTYLPDSILGQLQYKGPFNASNGNSVWTGANIGAASADNKGWYYIVTTPGSYSVTDSAGTVINSWQVGDWIVSGGAGGGWDKIDNTDAISSYNGRIGAIIPISSDITTATGLTLAYQATGFTIAGGTISKTLTVGNTLTLIGSDNAVLNITGSGGTLGSAAYTPSSAYATAAQGAKADNAYTKTESNSLFAPIAHVGDAGVNAHPLAVAGTSAGFMSASDKTKLDGIASGATNVTNTNQLANGAGFAVKTAAETITNNWTFSGQVAFTYVGAAPFTVASTTLVTNLNADRLDSQHGSYYLDCANFTGILAAARIPTLNQNTTGSSGSCTGNAATVTTNANLTGHVTSVGNTTSLGSFTAAELSAAVSDADVVTSVSGTPVSFGLVFSSGNKAWNPPGANTRPGTTAGATTGTWIRLVHNGQVFYFQAWPE